MRLGLNWRLSVLVLVLGCSSGDDADSGGDGSATTSTSSNTEPTDTSADNDGGPGSGPTTGATSSGTSGAASSTGTVGADDTTEAGTATTGGDGGFGTPCRDDLDCDGLPCGPLSFCADSCSPAGDCVPGPPEQLCFVPGDVAGACIPTCAPPNQGAPCLPCPADFVCVFGDTGLNLFPAVGPTYVCVPPVYADLFDPSACD